MRLKSFYNSGLGRRVPVPTIILYTWQVASRHEIKILLAFCVHHKNIKLITHETSMLFTSEVSHEQKYFIATLHTYIPPFWVLLNDLCNLSFYEVKTR